MLARARPQRAGAHDRAVRRQADRADQPGVLPQRLVEHQPEPAPVAGHQRDARADRSPQTVRDLAAVGQHHAPFVRPPEPADELEHRVVAGAGDARQARRSRPPARAVSTAPARPRPPRRAARAGRRRPSSTRFRDCLLELRVGRHRGLLAAVAEHRVDDLRHRELRARLRAHLDVAVAQHGDLVAQRHHVLEDVRDEHDADLAVAQHAQRVEQQLGALLAERGGRLVEDQHARLGEQRPGDLDQLALGERQLLEPRAQRDVEPESAQHRPARPPSRARETNGPRRSSRIMNRFARTSRSGEQVELLRDDRDAAAAPPRRWSRSGRLAVERSVARVRLERARRRSSRASTCRRRSPPAARAPSRRGP